MSTPIPFRVFRDNWDGLNRHGQRGAQRGRGGRGVLMNFGPNNTDEQLTSHTEKSSEINDEAGTEVIITSFSECNRDTSEKMENDAAKKDVESKRELLNDEATQERFAEVCVDTAERMQGQEAALVVICYAYVDFSS